jgi:hypothetical protein
VHAPGCISNHADRNQFEQDDLHGLPRLVCTGQLRLTYFDLAARRIGAIFRRGMNPEIDGYSSAVYSTTTTAKRRPVDYLH